MKAPYSASEARQGTSGPKTAAGSKLDPIRVLATAEALEASKLRVEQLCDAASALMSALPKTNQHPYMGPEVKRTWYNLWRLVHLQP